MTAALKTAFALCLGTALGCTNILVSKGASADGSTQIAYNADSGGLYGSLGHIPAAKHAAGAKREIWDWDSSKFLGEIPEVAETYNVVGNSNEHGLIIGETTFGGLPELDGAGTSAVVDYGSLIWLALQRAKTAREAIKVMDELVQTHGYASDGESFSLADPEEVFLMELIGKGNETGAVWVAVKVPDGMIGSTANQARIQTFDHDSKDTLYSKDVVAFAQSKGLYPKDADPKLFSFSDTYDPPTFSGVRLGEARVWNIFNPLSGGAVSGHLDYAQGYNLTNRMPLFVTPARKLSVNDTMHAMRTHFEGSWFDNRGVPATAREDVGAGPGNSPYRWRPLGWQHGGKSYVNERTVGVQQTGWAYVAQSRAGMPAPMRALFWFAPDESSTAVRIPVYGGATRIPPSFGDPLGQDPTSATSYGVQGDAYKMSMDSAFWVWNLVANMAYGERYNDVMPVIQQRINHYQGQFFEDVAAMDKKAAALFAAGKQAEGLQAITEFGVATGEQMTKDWRNFWMELFATFRDGFTVGAPALPTCDRAKQQRSDCTARPVPDAAATGYTDAWYGRIVADDKQHHYAVPPAHQHAPGSRMHALEARKRLRMEKRRV